MTCESFWNYTPLIGLEFACVLDAEADVAAKGLELDLDNPAPPISTMFPSFWHLRRSCTQRIGHALRVQERLFRMPKEGACYVDELLLGIWRKCI